MIAGTIATSRVIRRRSHGRRRMLTKPSITICPASVPVSVAFCPEQSSAIANSTPGRARAKQRRQQLVRVADVRDRLVAAAVKRRRRHDEDGGVDEERRHQRDRRIDGRKANRLGLARMAVDVPPRLDDRRVQVEVVRHHRRAEDAERDVEHVRIREHLGARNESGQHANRIRPRQRQFHGEACRDRHDQRDDQRLDVAKPLVLQEEHDEDVERRQRDAPDERETKQQVQRDRRADHFGQIAGRNRDLAENPQPIVTGHE